MIQPFLDCFINQGRLNRSYNDLGCSGKLNVNQKDNAKRTFLQALCNFGKHEQAYTIYSTYKQHYPFDVEHRHLGDENFLVGATTPPNFVLSLIFLFWWILKLLSKLVDENLDMWAKIFRTELLILWESDHLCHVFVALWRWFAIADAFAYVKIFLWGFFDDF